MTLHQPILAKLAPQFPIGADRRNTSLTYEGMVKAYRPMQGKQLPWGQQFNGETIAHTANEWSSCPNAATTIFTEMVIHSIPRLSIMEELDEPTTEEELGMAIPALSKAIDDNRITAEVIQCAKSTLLPCIKYCLL